MYFLKSLFYEVVDWLDWLIDFHSMEMLIFALISLMMSVIATLH